MQHSIRSDVRPGDLGRLIALHGTGYADEPAHYGLGFEAFVAASVGEFILGNGGRGSIFFAEDVGGALVGCIAMVDRGRRGQLRWLVVAPEARGTGLGKRLVDLAMADARTRGFEEVYLETVNGLDASMDMYRRLGFIVVDESDEDLWHPSQRTKVTMALRL